MFKILITNIFFIFFFIWGGGGLRQMNIFGVMKILWIFLGSSQNWTFLCILWYFLKVKVQNGYNKIQDTRNFI